MTDAPKFLWVHSSSLYALIVFILYTSLVHFSVLFLHVESRSVEGERVEVDFFRVDWSCYESRSKRAR